MSKEDVWRLAEKEKLSAAQLAMSFILSHAEISTVIPGIRTAQHVQQNTTGLKQLSEENKMLLQQLSKDWEEVVQLMENQG